MLAILANFRIRDEKIAFLNSEILKNEMIIIFKILKHALLLYLMFFFYGCKIDNEIVEKAISEKIFSPRNYDHINDQPVIKIGFGSCLDQEKKMGIFESIKLTKPDMFLMIGDNVYGDARDGELRKMAVAYRTQKANFRSLALNFPIESIWDDHDYGVNDGGSNYRHKEIAEKMFLDFWEIPPNDVRRSRAGLYRDQLLKINNKTVQIIYLDTRFHRGKLALSDKKSVSDKGKYIASKDKTQTMLGENQWGWLKEKLSIVVDFRLIVSSIQFLAIGHGWECWQMLPHERLRMMDLFDKYNLDNIVFLTGDRHRAGIYQFITKDGNKIHEITSSPLNASTFPGEENGPLRIGTTYTDINFGLITINTSKNILRGELINNSGEIINSIKVEYGH